MGLGITQVCAQAGCNVIAIKATPGSWEKAKSTLDRSLGKMVERGKMEAEDKEAILGRVTFSTDERAVADCEVVIESIIEEIDTKKDLFRRLESICRPDALLTTNTSTLSVTAMMAVCKHRSRVAGLHFFNPAPVMKLVEIIHAFETSDDTIQKLDELCRKLGKDPVLVQDTHRLHRQPAADAIHAERDPYAGARHWQHREHRPGDEAGRGASHGTVRARRLHRP